MWCAVWMTSGQKDDMRQDRVIQQLLGIVNRLFAVAPETRSKGLSLRTYNVCFLVFSGTLV